MHVASISTMAALALSFVGAPAAADTVNVTIRSTVRTDHLDLSNPADLATLEQRIKRAVRALCGARLSQAINAAEARMQCRESAQRSASQELARVLSEDRRRALATLSKPRATD